MTAHMRGAEGLIGQIVGGYRLVGLLGTGFSGAVYRGERVTHQAAGEPPWEASALPAIAAIKLFLPPENLTAAALKEFHSRFLREAKVFHGKRHPRIVPVLASGEDSTINRSYLIMPYLSGGTLAKTLAKQPGGLPFEMITRSLGQVAEGLDFAHSQGIVHRDIKPANILFDEDGNAYIADFSIMRQEDVHTTVTSTGAVLGTYAYMAPEQARDPKKVGPEADIYGLGCVLYEMVTGRLPFPASSVAQMLEDHARKDPEAPHLLRRDLKPPAETAIYKALAKNPQARFHRAGELAHAFNDGVKGQWSAGLTTIKTTLSDVEPSTIAPFAPAPTVIATRPRRKSVLLAVALLLVVGLLAMLARTGFPTAGSSTSGQSGGPTATSSTTMAQQTTSASPGASPSVSAPTTQPGPVPTSTHVIRPTNTFVPTNTPVPQPVLQVQVGSCPTVQIAPGGPLVLLSTSLRALKALAPGNGSGGDQYPPIIIRNVGAATLNWTGTTSDFQYPMGPPFGSLGPNTSQTVDISGPSGGPNPLTVSVSSNGGSWQKMLPPC